MSTHMTLRSRPQLLVSFMLLLSAGCADQEPAGQSESPAVAVSAQELAARELAAQGIEAQPRDVQKRYYQAQLMTQQQSLATAQQLVADLTKQNGTSTARAADRASASAELTDARAAADKRQQRVRELQTKLASF